MNDLILPLSIEDTFIQIAKEHATSGRPKQMDDEAVVLNGPHITMQWSSAPIPIFNLLYQAWLYFFY